MPTTLIKALRIFGHKLGAFKGNLGTLPLMR
jgi:hypothetical protein